MSVTLIPIKFEVTVVYDPADGELCYTAVFGETLSVGRTKGEALTRVLARYLADRVLAQNYIEG